MTVTVQITKSFRKAAKPLLKKYPSLRADLIAFEQTLLQSPNQGVLIGQNVYKIRLKISSKGKGKSGGARIISLVETVIIGEVNQTAEACTVNLITIYDKTDNETISDKELKNLLEAFQHEE